MAVNWSLTMQRPRAADDYATIRARMEELRRESKPAPSATIPAAPSANIIGHRGPCSCGLSLFPDECDGCCKAL
jgi:hypothetical protein